MKFTVMKPVEIDIDHVVIDVPVNYGDEYMPLVFPHRNEDRWRIVVDIQTGQIRNWPTGHPATQIDMKVVDGGCYELCAADGTVLAKRLYEYVPHLVPGEYGDYIDFHIDENGVITNWPKKPDVSEFFQHDA